MSKHLGSINVQDLINAARIQVRTGAAAGKYLEAKDGTGEAQWAQGDTPLVNVIWVSSSAGSDTEGSGTENRPYATVQKALDQIPAATGSATARVVHVVVVCSGTYDESPAIDIGRKKVVVLGLGPVNFGTFGGSNWAPSGTPRNFVVTCSLANIDSIRCSLALISLSVTQTGTHQQYSGNMRISGTLQVSNSTGGSSGELQLRGLGLMGWDGVANGNSDSITATAWAGNLNLYAEDVRFYGLVTGVARLQRALRCRFEKLVTVATYSLLADCEIAAGMTWTVAPTEVPPIGLRGCVLTGTFTGASNSDLFLDAVSNASFLANACVVANSAKRILTEAALSIGNQQYTVAADAYTVPETTTASMMIAEPSSSWAVYLPALNENTYGRTFTFVNTSAVNTWTVTRNGTQTTDRIFDAATTAVALGPGYQVSVIGGNAASKIWYAA